MTPFSRTLAALVLAVSIPTTLHADAIGIVAVANEKPITTLDVDDRQQLITAMRGVPNDPAEQKKLRQQIIRQLVDETLQQQEADRMGISTSDEEIENAIGTIEKQQGKPSGDLKQMIESSGLSFRSFEQQVRTQILWSKAINKKVRRNVKVSDSEVKAAQQRWIEDTPVEELQISSVVLPMVNAGDEPRIKALAESMAIDLQTTSDRAAVLKTYDANAPLRMSEVTWVQRDQLEPDVRDAIAGLKKGQVSKPLRTPFGYQLITYHDSRTIKRTALADAEMALKQVILKLQQDAGMEQVDIMMDIARRLAKNPGSCTQSGIGGVQDFEGLEMQVNYIRTTLSNMSPEIRPLVEKLSVNQITEPFATLDGIHLLMLCEKIEVPPKLPDETKVRERLIEEKMQLESEKYLRNLRREALIDVRG